MKVAVLGFGTIGVGIYEMLQNAQGLEASKVLVRPGKADADYKVTDIYDIINDDSIEAVAEAMGGIEPAFTYASEVLKAGKHFVTSNKALVAAKGPELARIAEKTGAGFLFSAACGGGVPILHNLALAVKSDEILSVGGILNGTTNYMLDAIQRRDMTYEEALKDAQKLGYAEADPTADVTGLDALRKIMLACAVAYNILPDDGLHNEGIDSFTADDASYLKKHGLTCRLIVSGMKNGESVSAYVEPVVFTSSAPECSVLKNFNMAKYDGKNSGKIVLMGQGAGRYPTASAVLRDLSDILNGCRYMMRSDVKVARADNSLSRHKYLIRLPKDHEDYFECIKEENYGNYSYVYTNEMSVTEMHEKVAEIRKDGEKVFFAAVEE